MRTTAVMLVLVALLAAAQDAEAGKRGKGKRGCRRERNRQWCNKDNVEELNKDHPAVAEANIEKGRGNTGEQECPAGKIGLADDDIRDPNERSLTPWTYVINHSPNRIPETYVEAKCLCDGCLIYGPDGVSVENSKDFENVPIQTRLPILERYDCKKGKCKERQTTIPVTVGCMCATRKRTTVPATIPASN